MGIDAAEKPKTYPQDHLINRLILWTLPEWIKPNHITVLRFILTVPVVWLIYLENYDLATALFIITALTDAIDGAMARIRNQITEWGELFDPVADKLLIGLVGFLLIFRFLHWWLIVIILSLEFITVFAAMVVKAKYPQIPIRANIFGKTKMILQCLGVILLLIFAQMPDNAGLSWTISGIFSLSIVFTVLSMRYAGI